MTVSAHPPAASLPPCCFPLKPKLFFSFLFHSNSGSEALAGTRAWIRQVHPIMIVNPRLDFVWFECRVALGRKWLSVLLVLCFVGQRGVAPRTRASLRRDGGKKAKNMKCHPRLPRSPSQFFPNPDEYFSWVGASQTG